MAAIVCQGLQSCLESQVLEPRTLRLRLSSPKPHFSQPLELNMKSCFFDSNTKQVDENTKQSDAVHEKNMNISPNADSGCWSFLQVISNGSQLSSKSETTDKQNAYVHPLAKRSMSTLSEKSLELCTESLGSETGTDIIEDSIFSLSSDYSSSPSSEDKGTYGENSQKTREEQKSRHLLGAKKASSRSFPPPLTTISGLNSLQMIPHREDGRLIIKAIKVPSKHSLFQAERSHGRLRLLLFEDSHPFFDSEEEAVSDEIHNDNEGCKEEDIENDSNYGEEEEEEGREEEEDDLVEENDAIMGEENNENKIDVRGEMGMKKFQRPGRCKEGETEKKELLNWEAHWVATS